MFAYLLTVGLLVAVNAKPSANRVSSTFPNGRIVGGENAVIETYPYQISLEIFGRHSCGGSIIAANWIVTAGHCVGSSVSSMTIRAGSSMKGKGGSVHRVDKIVRHEKYWTNDYGVPFNDVAVVHVREAFDFDDTRRPVNLYEMAEEAVPGLNSVVTGWGNTGKGSPVQLQTVTVPIVSKKLCNNAYKKYGGLPAGQICAAYYGVGGKDACQGDSGGPLTINGRLAGIVSWGNGCAEAKYPGVYTEIAAFRDWINEHAQL